MYPVWTLSGLWHGAAWSFVVWGGIHGVYLITSILTQSYRTKCAKALALDRVPGLRVLRSLNVCALVGVAWVFFRARSLHDAFYIIGHMWNWKGFTGGTLWALGLPRFEMAVAVISIAVLFVVEGMQVSPPKVVHAAWRYRPVRWAAYLSAAYCIIFLGLFGRVDFIYFQF